jgi:hypothetical protein
LFHRAPICRIAGQVIPTQSFDRKDPAGPDEPRRTLDGIAVNLLQVAIEQLKLRTTLRAGDRLRVKASVAGIFVFRLAFGAHLEDRHRCVWTVVRNGPHNREAWAAIGAIGERVPVTARRRIPDLGQALIARGRVSCYVRFDGSLCSARPNLEGD